MSTASPAKRRKKNDSTATATKGPNLDFFFGKKRVSAEKSVENPEDKKDINAILDEADNEGLTDEELARKLQAQWEKEDAQSVPNTNPIKREIVSAQELDPVTSDHEPMASSIIETGADPNLGTSDIHKSDRKTSSLPEKVAPVLLVSELDWEEGVAAFPFDQDPLTFDPYAHKALFDKFPDGRATYSLLTRAFVLINSTRSRIKIVDTLTNLLRTLIANDAQSLLPAVRTKRSLCTLAKVDFIRFG